MVRWDAVVWWRWELSAMVVRVGVRHMRGHVSVVLIIMSACPAPLLVHIGVVCVGWRQRVEVVGCVVCSGCFTRAWSAIS